MSKENNSSCLVKVASSQNILQFGSNLHKMVPNHDLFFGDWSQNEKLSEIKPTSIKSVLYENESRFTYGLAIVQFLSHTFKMLKQSRFLNHDYNLVT